MPCVDGQARIGEPVEVHGRLIEIVNFAHESPGHCTETFNGERYAAVLFTRACPKPAALPRPVAVCSRGCAVAAGCWTASARSGCWRASSGRSETKYQVQTGCFEYAPLTSSCVRIMCLMGTKIVVLSLRARARLPSLRSRTRCFHRSSSFPP